MGAKKNLKEALEGKQPFLRCLLVFTFATFVNLVMLQLHSTYYGGEVVPITSHNFLFFFFYAAAKLFALVATLKLVASYLRGEHKKYRR